MLCRIPGCKLEAAINHRYCGGHREAMNEVWPEIEAAAIARAEMAAYRLKRPLERSLAEETMPVVEFGWQPGEIIKAIKTRMAYAGVDRAILVLPGVDTVSAALLKVSGRMLGCHVDRGRGPDTLYVDGYVPPPAHPPLRKYSEIKRDRQSQ